MAILFQCRKYLRVFMCAVFTLALLQSMALGATSVTQSTGDASSGIEGVPSLPGTEITPQDMQKHFPKPLGGSASHMPFMPDAAPLIPALPLQSTGTGTGTGGGSQEQGEQMGQGGQRGQSSSRGEHNASQPNGSLQENAAGASSTGVFLPQVPASPPPYGVEDARMRTPQQKALQERLLQATGQHENVDNAQGDESSPAGNALARSEQVEAEGFPPLEFMLGQMIMAGFTGTEVEGPSPIVALIKAGKVGGVFLEPIPPKESKAQAPMLAMAPSGFSAQQSAALLGQVGPHGNIESAGQARRLIATLQSYVPPKGLALWVGVEQEGGQVQTLRKDLGFEGLASAARLGQGSTEATEIAARRSGIEMAGLGINFVLGPAADVNINPLSEDIGRRFRSFGSDAQQVAQHVMAFGRGLLAANVLPCLRNFPGTGSYVRGFTPAPTSMGGQRNILETLPDISYTWQQHELTPYRESIQRALGLEYGVGASGAAADGTKSGHKMVYFAIQPALAYHRVLDSLRPVPFSSTALTAILRGQWAFQGLVLSQDLRALQPFFSLEDSVLQSVQAGADILFVTEPVALVNAANSPLAGLGALSGLPGVENLEELVGLMDNAKKDAQQGNEEALLQMLMQSGAGKFLPNALSAQVKAKPLTGIATEAEKVFATLLSLVRAGRISEARVRASWLRIKAAKASVGIL